MDWTVLQDGLKSLVASVSGIEAHNLVWDGEPEAMRGYPMGLLQLMRQGRDTSTDEMRFETADDGSQIPVIIGQRTLVMQLTVRSRDQRGPNKAFAILERMRTRLELPVVQEQLDELGVVLRDSAPTQDRSVVSQQREESMAELSMTLGYVVEERDEENAESWIERVEYSGETTDAAQGGTTINTDNAAALVYDDDSDYLTLG